MINLLPPLYKQEFRQEQNFHLTVILGFLALLFLVSFSLLLVAIRVYLTGQIQVRELLLESQKREMVQQEASRSEIKEVNRTQRDVYAFYKDEVSGSAIFQRLSSLLPPDVYLTALSYNPAVQTAGKQANAEIFLTGFAPTREAVLKLQENLRSEEIFLALYSPPTNWVIPINVTFAFQFEVSPSFKKEE